jgi:hypothetical protein
VRERDGLAPLGGRHARPTQRLARALAAPEPRPEVAGQVGARQVGHVEPRPNDVASPGVNERAEYARVGRARPDCRRRPALAPGLERQPAARVQKNDGGPTAGAQARERGRVEGTIRQAQAETRIGVAGIV